MSSEDVNGVPADEVRVSARQAALSKNILSLSLFGSAIIDRLRRLVSTCSHRLSLAGSVPPELGDLGTLEQLYLSHNKLSGESSWKRL